MDGGLNPFCFGVWGLRICQKNSMGFVYRGLNPFCFGVWGLRKTKRI